MPRSCFFGCLTEGPTHQFPKPKYPDLERFNLWKMVLSESVKQKDDNYIYNNIRLCDCHFEWYFRSPSKRLTKNAVPTLNISKKALYTAFPVINKIVESKNVQQELLSERKSTAGSTNQQIEIEICGSLTKTNKDLNETAVPAQDYLIKDIKMEPREEHDAQIDDIQCSQLEYNLDDIKMEPREEHNAQIDDIQGSHLEDHLNDIKMEPREEHNTQIDDIQCSHSEDHPAGSTYQQIEIEICASTTSNKDLNEKTVPAKSGLPKAQKRRHTCRESRQLILKVQKLKAKCRALKQQVRQARKLSLHKAFLKGVKTLPEAAQSKTLKKSQGR